MTDPDPEVCEVCGASPLVEGAAPGADPLQGLGLLLDRLRPRLRDASATRPTASRGRRQEGREGEKKDEKPEKKAAADSRLVDVGHGFEPVPMARATRTPSVWFPVTHPGPYAPEPGGGGCGAESPVTIGITLAVLLGRDDLAAARLAAEPAVKGRAAALSRNFDQPSERKPCVERSVATGASRSSPMNGSLTSVPKPSASPATACSTCWLCSAREKSVSAGFELVLPHARVDQRAAPVHVLLALREAPAVPPRAPLLRRVRAVELGDDRSRARRCRSRRACRSDPRTG